MLGGLLLPGKNINCFADAGRKTAEEHTFSGIVESKKTAARFISCSVANLQCKYYGI